MVTPFSVTVGTSSSIAVMIEVNKASKSLVNLISIKASALMLLSIAFVAWSIAFAKEAR